MKKPTLCRELVVRRVTRRMPAQRPVTTSEFARALLGQETAFDVCAPDADSARARLEWLAQISTRHEQLLQQLLHEEAEAREAQERAEFLQAIEGNWDPGKHPRGGFSQNRGWFSPTGGASDGSRSFDRLSQSLAHLTTQSQGLARGLVSHPLTQTQLTDRTPNGLQNHVADGATRPARQNDSHSGNEPLSHDDLLTYLRVLYGEKGQRLLNAFLRSGGRITVEGLWIGNSSLSSRNAWGPHQIRVDQGLNPAEAAHELMQRLIESTGLTEVRQHLDHSGFANIETLIASYKQSVKSAAAFVSLASQLYLSGVSIVSEGADWVITIHELSEGSYQAAIGLLPLLPAVVGKTKIILKHGDETLRISAEAARGAQRYQ